ncbi:hypothetical protein TSMEX_008594 [Taenia solium]|eukprot:TsM_001027400 transcript=TsM_001027400 gene=TsM_001027400
METNQPSAGTEQSSYRLHLRNESGGQMMPTVPTLVLENLSSFLQSCCENTQPAHQQPPNHYHQSMPSKPQIEWVYSQHNFSSGRSPELLRMKARELIQQERCDANFSYCVDQPSRLVRIECLKAGCKCVLKQEPALALKIVCGVSLVRGSWSSLQQQNSHGSHHPAKWGSISSAFERLQPNRFSNSCQSSQCQTPLDQPLVPNTSNNNSSNDQIPLIFTSCSPFWFEILRQHNDASQGPEVPCWNSGKALWKARPSMFLLRKQTKCVLSVSSNGSRGPVTLDLDNVVHLHPGTVLRLIDCKSCRLVSKNNPQCPPMSSLLQCEVVGSKSLAKYASLANNLPPDDALYWFASGPRLVYLPLDDKTVSFYPIATPPPNSRDNKNTGWAHSGAHSVLNLLSYFPLPLTVRPVMEHSLANWLTSSSPCIRDGNAGLHLTSCYHGDLVFLEPIADCGPAAVTNNNGVGTAGGNSRFFVVTAEMLSQHRFILATPQSSQLHARELKTHASRVAHFLAAFHPACGLNYLLKYLEDVTHCSSVGPPHRPLTETLGPLGGEGTVASHTAVASIAASMLLYLDTDDRDRFPDLHALYDDLDDIYQYVRTGRLPSKQRGVIPSSGMLRSCSATPGPAPRTRSRQDYTAPYVFFPESNLHSSNNTAVQQQQQQPPPPPRRNMVTPTHAYAYPNPSKYALKSDIPSPLPFASPSRRRQAYVDCARLRSIEQPFCGQPPPSYSILNFAAINERTNSSPDTGLGGDSGQSGQSLIVPTATTSIVRSSCHQLINFCENGVNNEGEVTVSMKSPQLIYPNLRRLTVNLNKRIL